MLPDPMLASAGPLPRGPGWSFEVKWDGIRAIVATGPHGVRARSRPGRDLTAIFPELGWVADAVDRRRLVLDGELTVLGDDGRPDFEAVRRRLHAPGRTAVLQVFDVLAADGEPIVAQPYRERRALLDEFGLDAPRAHDDGAALLAATARLDLEGVVAKRLDSRYRPGRRSSDWVKVKHRRDGVFRATRRLRAGVLVEADGERGTIRGAVELGVPRDVDAIVGRDVVVGHGCITAGGWLREPVYRGLAA